jgi:DNA mismatch endonuclease (patch repair protein)
MRRVKSSGTSLEMLLRKNLWGCGLRYRLKSKLFGKPDLVFPGAKVCVFVDSCFWHGCPRHCRMPSSNQDYWKPKISRNIERDLLVTETLSQQEWKVVRLWEHDMRSDLDVAVNKVRQAVSSFTETI